MKRYVVVGLRGGLGNQLFQFAAVPGHCDTTVLSIDLPTQSRGWFQSDRSFSHVADEVVERLRLPDAKLLRPPNLRPIDAVIANSSCAWWGAWLGDQRARTGLRLVIAPEDDRQRWGPDILPSNWIAITS